MGITYFKTIRIHIVCKKTNLELGAQTESSRMKKAVQTRMKRAQVTNKKLQYTENHILE